jgi:hypothetical protein
MDVCRAVLAAFLMSILFTAVGCEPNYPLLGTYEFTEQSYQTVPSYVGNMSFGTGDLEGPEEDCQSAEIEQVEPRRAYFELYRQERGCGAKMSAPYLVRYGDSKDNCDTGGLALFFDPESLELREPPLLLSHFVSGSQDSPEHCFLSRRTGRLEPTDDGVRMIVDEHKAAVTDVDEEACTGLEIDKISELDWTCVRRTVRVGERVEAE